MCSSFIVLSFFLLLWKCEMALSCLTYVTQKLIKHLTLLLLYFVVHDVGNKQPLPSGHVSHWKHPPRYWVRFNFKNRTRTHRLVRQTTNNINSYYERYSHVSVRISSKIPLIYTHKHIYILVILSTVPIFFLAAARVLGNKFSNKFNLTLSYYILLW